jgi:hypothetical protein
MVIRIHEFDNAPAAEALDSFQHFWSEFIRVVGNDVSLDFVRASPHELAERASTTWCVHVVHVSSELLVSSKARVTIYTDRPDLAVHVTTSLVLWLGAVLEGEMSPSSVGRRIGLLPHLIQDRPRSDLYAGSMEVPRSGKFYHATM